MRNQKKKIQVAGRISILRYGYMRVTTACSRLRKKYTTPTISVNIISTASRSHGEAANGIQSMLLYYFVQDFFVPSWFLFNASL
jgi:hypothetical protein